MVRGLEANLSSQSSRIVVSERNRRSNWTRELQKLLKRRARKRNVELAGCMVGSGLLSDAGFMIARRRARTRRRMRKTRRQGNLRQSSHEPRAACGASPRRRRHLAYDSSRRPGLVCQTTSQRSQSVHGHLQQRAPWSCEQFLIWNLPFALLHFSDTTRH